MLLLITNSSGAASISVSTVCHWHQIAHLFDTKLLRTADAMYWMQKQWRSLQQNVKCECGALNSHHEEKRQDDDLQHVRCCCCDYHVELYFSSLMTSLLFILVFRSLLDQAWSAEVNELCAATYFSRAELHIRLHIYTHNGTNYHSVVVSLH